MTDRSDHCVYLYRAPTTQKIVYVGRGATPGRAVQHTGGSHKPGLSAIIDTGDYSVELAGPYLTPEAAAAVEAALISALRLPTSQAALTNAAHGDGPRFRPFGVPSDYSDRLLLPPLTVAEIGVMTGGALIVGTASAESSRRGGPAWTRCTRRMTSSQRTSGGTGCCSGWSRAGSRTRRPAPRSF